MFWMEAGADQRPLSRADTAGRVLGCQSIGSLRNMGEGGAFADLDQRHVRALQRDACVFGQIGHA